MSRATHDLITLHHVMNATLHTPPLESGLYWLPVAKRVQMFHSPDLVKDKNLGKSEFWGNENVG